MNQSIEFLQAIDELQHKKIPEEVLARVRQSLLDYLAASSIWDLQFFRCCFRWLNGMTLELKMY